MGGRKMELKDINPKNLDAEKMKELRKKLISDHSYLFSLFTETERKEWSRISDEGGKSPAEKAENKAARSTILVTVFTRERDHALATNMAEEAFVFNQRLEGFSLALAANQKKAATEAAKTPTPEPVLMRYGKAMPWFGKEFSPLAQALSHLAALVWLLAIVGEHYLGIPVARPIATMVVVVCTAYNVAQCFSWYWAWNTDSKMLRRKTKILPFITIGLMLSFGLENSNVHQEFILFSGVVIFLGWWIGFSNWALKFELLLSLLILALVLMWDVSGRSENIARYEALINNQAMPFSMGNLALKFEAMILGAFNIGLKLILILKIHYVLVFYSIYQAWFFRLYVKDKQFTYTV